MITAWLVVVALAALAAYGWQRHGYWRARRVPHDLPLPFVGNNARVLLLRRTVAQLAVELYERYPAAPVVGFYRSSRPELVVRDPAIIKRVLLTDFPCFHSRGLNPSKEVVEPLFRNLFFADGDLWRLLRQRLTPAFTSGKLRAMFPLVVQRAERLQMRLALAADQVLDARDLMARYTIDFIGACAFGLEADALKDDNSAFKKLGDNIFKIGAREVVVIVLKELFPEKFKHLKFLPKLEAEIRQLVDAILKQRNYEPSGRNDFIDLLLECKKKGTMTGESIERKKSDGSSEIVTVEFTDDLIMAQVFAFFVGGFDTSSTVTGYTLHQLAHHPAAQARAHQEVDRVLAKYHHKLCYDALKEMTYLECALKEGMRMFPPLGFLIRECAHHYTIPELNLSIDPGVKIVVPVHALHYDPQYFDDPLEFRPERFMKERYDQEQYKWVYLPFGDGPRGCIGTRLALLQSLAGLAAVLARFSVAPAPGSVRRPRVATVAGLTQSVENGLPLIFRERRRKSGDST